MPLSNRHNVLIVDDERLIADTLATIFRQAGYTSKAAYSAETVLASASDWTPHLAILDVVLPGMNGIQLARWLKSICPQCHILLLSGQSATSDLLDSEDPAIAWTALPKPVPPGELLALAAARLEIRTS